MAIPGYVRRRHLFRLVNLDFSEVGARKSWLVESGRDTSSQTLQHEERLLKLGNARDIDHLSISDLRFALQNARISRSLTRRAHIKAA